MATRRPSLSVVTARVVVPTRNHLNQTRRVHLNDTRRGKVKVMTPSSDANHWSRIPTRAPWAFWCGGLLGAVWPFVLFYAAWHLSSGANLAITGPKNWADKVLEFSAMLSYTGCSILLLLPIAMLIGLMVGGYITAFAVVILRGLLVSKADERSG